MEIQDVTLEKISIYGGTQTRAATNDEAVAHYAEEMEAGTVFPPVTVFFDGATHWLADGFHRYLAARKNEYATIPAEVREGDRGAALEHALGANSTNGLFRTNADKRHAIEVALEEWPDRSNAVLAEICHVSTELVRRCRKSLDIPAPETVTGRDGRQYPSRVERQPRGGGQGDGGGSQGGGGRPSKKQAAADMPFGGSSKEMETAAADMERKGETSFLRPGDPLPSSATGLARMAIALLEKIRETDPERSAALGLVQDWLDARPPRTGEEQSGGEPIEETAAGANHEG